MQLRDRFRLYLITDDRGGEADVLVARIEAALRGGVGAVQLREKKASPAQLARLIELIAPLCRRHDTPLLLNVTLWHPALPLELIDGLHFQAATWPPAHGSDLAAWFLPRRDGLLLVYSAHSVGELERVRREGISIATISPLYPTPSKEGILAPLGPAAVSQARAAAPDAVIIGLGGIDVHNAAEVVAAGADGVAVIRAVLAAPDPEAAARRLRGVVDAASRERHHTPRQ
jgi:thiamine-phosphate pyrophosphorylase